MDISTVDELLSTTRAVRRRLDLTRPVEREVIVECLRLAIQAPTASNDQNWRWMVVTDPDKRSAIADIYRGCGEEYLAHAARTTPDPQTRKVYESAHALSKTLAQVPVHVIPCIESRFDGNQLVVAASAWASIIPAAWSFMLALRARGLGSVWTTLHLPRLTRSPNCSAYQTMSRRPRCCRWPTRSAPTSNLPAGLRSRPSPRGTPGVLTDAVLHGYFRGRGAGA